MLQREFFLVTRVQTATFPLGINMILLTVKCTVSMNDDSCHVELGELNSLPLLVFMIDRYWWREVEMLV